LRAVAAEGRGRVRGPRGNRRPAHDRPGTAGEGGMTAVVTPGTASGRTPPGPPRRAMFSLLRKLGSDRLGLMTEARDEYGDAVRVVIGPKTLYIFNHPDHAK